ncbi:MAG: hypothetical protein NTY73_03000 [Candidatus Micrarchaeota archaeon]|nr:hypothetical protein [Candidatus Micrarchaeota archaeon]
MADVTAPVGTMTLQEQMDLIIDDIDDSIAGKYVFTLRDLLENPDDYADTPDIGKEIDRLKVDVNLYFEKKRAEAADQVSKYKDDALKATRLADKVGGAVKDKAKIIKKPFVTPLFFVRKEDEDEVLFIDNYDTSYEALLDEMIKGSMFVVDASLVIENFKVGRWIFVGENKNRGLYVFFPVNPIGVLDIAKDQMTMALDGLKIELESAEETEKK